MLKRLLIFVTLLFIFLSNALAAEETSSFRFKYYMHQIFDNYNHAYISYTLNKYEITDIYLKHLVEAAGEVKNFIPEKNKEGAKLDRERFSQRLDRLTQKVSELRSAIGKGEPKDIKQLPQEIFNTCVECHTEVKLKSLFKRAGHETLFDEYMHKVSQHMDMARIYIEAGASIETVTEDLKLIRYYLDLLEETFPTAGPSGVVMDKDAFGKRLKELQRINEEMMNKVKEKKPVSIEAFRQSLNGLCVACHEPERLK